MSGGGGSSQPATQTVTQTQQIPQFEQDFSQSNQNLAASLGSTPFPTYQAPLLADFNNLQWGSIAGLGDAANSYLPSLNQASGVMNNVAGNQNTFNNLGTQFQNLANQAPMLNNSAAVASQGFQAGGDASALNTQGWTDVNLGNKNMQLDPSNSATVQKFMSPYVQASLNPQILAANTQYGQQQQQINASATEGNAFGDSRQGVASALNNYYNNQNTAGIEAQGYNTAYNNALNTIGQQQQLGLNQTTLGQNAWNQAAGITQNNQNINLAGTNLQNQILTGQQQNLMGEQGQQIAQQAQTVQQSQQFAALAKQYQDQGLTANQAEFAAGQAIQQQQQQALNLQYQQFENAVNWPYQQLNVRESALSNSPYSMVNAVTLPGANSNTQNLNAFASLLGMGGGGGLFGGSLPAGTKA
jgi:hypothetical protein